MPTNPFIMWLPQHDPLRTASPSSTSAETRLLSTNMGNRWQGNLSRSGRRKTCLLLWLSCSLASPPSWALSSQEASLFSSLGEEKAAGSSPGKAEVAVWMSGWVCAPTARCMHTGNAVCSSGAVWALCVAADLSDFCTTGVLLWVSSVPSTGNKHQINWSNCG